MAATNNASTTPIVKQRPLLFTSSMGISNELSLLLGGYYLLCEQTFGEELRKEEEELAKRGLSDLTEHHPIQTPLPCVRRTAQYLEGAEGLSEATSVVGMTTKTGQKLNLVFRRDANGVPTMDF